MNLKKYTKMNRKYIVLTTIWFIYTLFTTIYLFNFSNNFYLEAKEADIANVETLELLNKEEVDHVYTPSYNAVHAYIQYDRVNLADNYTLRITTKDGSTSELQVPATNNTRLQKLRLIAPAKDTYILMQLTNQNDLYKSLITQWFVLFLLLSLGVYDFRRLVRLYKLPLHRLYVYIESPTLVDYIQAKDTLLHTRLRLNTQRIYQHVRQDNPNQAEVILKTFLNQKSRGMRIKVKLKNGDVLFFNPEMQRYTETTTVVFNAETQTLVNLRATGVLIVPPTRIKEKKG